MSAKTKKFRSKFFRVAVEGATCDGRTMDPQWLTQIARTFNPEKYGARISIEHIRGINPAWGFRAMGDVVAVKTGTFKMDGKDHLALYAQVEPTDEMVELVKSGQKIYTSIEIDPNFAGSGQAYLTGLGITDSPASLGTEMLTFSAQHPDASPLAKRKQSPHNHFTVAIESDIEFEEIEDKPSAVDQLFSRLADLLGKGSKPETPAPTGAPEAGTADFAKIGEAVTAVAEHVRQQDQRFAASERENADLKSQLQKLSADFAALKTQLEGTVVHSQPRRPAVTGNNNTEQTDC